MNDEVVEIETKRVKMVTKPTIYTEEFVEKELRKLLRLASEGDYLIMGKLFEERGYSAQRFSEWITRYPDNDEIKESHKRLKEIFENRLVENALRNKTNATMSIFNLKNNFGWKDKQEIEHGGSFSMFGLAHKELESPDQELLQ